MENTQKYKMVAYLNDKDVPKDLVVPVFEKIVKYNRNYVPKFYLGLGDDQYNSFEEIDKSITITFIDNIKFQLMMTSPVVREGDKPIFGHLEKNTLFVAPVNDMQEFLEEDDTSKELKEKIVNYKEYTKKLGTIYGGNNE